MSNGRLEVALLVDEDMLALLVDEEMLVLLVDEDVPPQFELSHIDGGGAPGMGI